jgi:hypothetical protein
MGRSRRPVLLPACDFGPSGTKSLLVPMWGLKLNPLYKAHGLLRNRSVAPWPCRRSHTTASCTRPESRYQCRRSSLAYRYSRFLFPATRMRPKIMYNILYILYYTTQYYTAQHLLCALHSRSYNYNLQCAHAPCMVHSSSPNAISIYSALLFFHYQKHMAISVALDRTIAATRNILKGREGGRRGSLRQKYMDRCVCMIPCVYIIYTGCGG